MHTQRNKKKGGRAARGLPFTLKKTTYACAGANYTLKKPLSHS